jgi:hypothetical protein
MKDCHRDAYADATAGGSDALLPLVNLGSEVSARARCCWPRQSSRRDLTLAKSSATAKPKTGSSLSVSSGFDGRGDHQTK